MLPSLTARLPLAFTLLGGASMLPLSAVELADLAGDWVNGNIFTPTRLQETYYNTVTMTSRISENSFDFAGNDEVLADAFYSSTPQSEASEFAFSATGAITGGEMGQVLSISNNRLNYTNGSEASMLYANLTGDLMVESSSTIDEQEISLLLKRPTTMTTSELAGDWNLVSLIVPNELGKNIVDGVLVDTFFASDGAITVASINANSTGVITGDLLGTLTATSPGVATVMVGPDTTTFNVNESKNVMVANLDKSDDQEIVILAKEPASLTTSDLAGTWRVASLTTPSELFETYLNVVGETTRQATNNDFAMPGEILIDLFHSDDFELFNTNLLVSPSGAFTGPGVGTLTANGDKSVTLSINGDLITFQINADKTFMITAVEDSESREIIVVVKTSNTIPESFADAIDLSITPQPGGAAALFWNGGSRLVLETASTLDTPTWSEITETINSNTYLTTASPGAQFFRVTEKPESP